MVFCLKLFLDYKKHFLLIRRSFSRFQDPIYNTVLYDLETRKLYPDLETRPFDTKFDRNNPSHIRSYNIKNHEYCVI